jgi:hypothetical protein
METTSGGAADGPQPQRSAADTGSRGTQLGLLLALAALASAGAGLVHAAAAGTHMGDTTLVRIFAVTAVVQLAWAAFAVVRPSRGVALAGVVLGAAALGAWVLSRTVGLPLVDSLSEVEPVSLQDGLAALLAGLSMLLAGMAALGDVPLRGRAPIGALGAVALLALAVPAVAAEHGHGPSHDHAGGEAAGSHHGAPAAQEHADDHAGDDHHESPDDAPHGEHAGEHPGGTVISLADERVSDTQRQAAQELIDTTVQGMARFTDVASVEAAGYVSIGDGVTGWEHFINVGHMADGVDMDPNRIESIVFKVYPDGTRQLASAMYILGFGATMDDVPDIAGELTTWHDHQDLCFAGTRVTGRVQPDGSCPRGGSLRPTAPMLHVWLIPHRCGPFAGIEGRHGSGCEHSHSDGGDEEAAVGKDEETAAGS